MSLHMRLQLLEYGTKVVPQHRQNNSTAQSYLSRSMPFYQLTVVLADLSVHQTVIITSERDPNPEPLVWRRAVVAKHSLDATTAVDDLNDFVEPNGPDWDADPESKLESQRPRLTPVLDRPHQHPTVEQTTVYEALLDETLGGRENASLEVVTDQLRELMRRNSLDVGSCHM